MISAVFFRQNGRPAGFRASGHSGYAEAGSDVVCAAVSAAVSLTECLLDDVLKAGAKVRVDAKNASVELRLPGSAANEQFEPALRALRLYLESLQGEYPDHIVISEE